MAHQRGCATSIATPREDCECDCAKRLHGLPHSARVGPLFSEDLDSARLRNATTRRRRLARKAEGSPEFAVLATDFLVSHTAEWLLAGEWATTSEPLESLVDKLSVSMHKELFNAASDAATRDEVVRLINTEHLICSLCIGYLRLVDLGQDLVQLACEKIVDAALGAALPEDTDVLVRTATSKVLSKSLFAAFPVPGNPAETAAVQFLALITCPEWSTHPDNAVVKECVTPHFAEAFSEAELDWIQNGSPGPVVS